MLMSLAEDRWFRMETSIKFHNLLSIQDGAEYYDPPGGLLSFDMNISEYLEPASHLDLDTSKPIKLENFNAHFALVNAQLLQVRHYQAC
jgi:hypothetical protein